MRVRFWVLILLAGPIAACAQVVTSDVTAVPPRAWSIPSVHPWYLQVVAKQSGVAMDLTDRRVIWTIRHDNTEALVLSSTGTIHDADAGEVIFRWTPPSAGSFRSIAHIVSSNNVIIAPLMDDTITVTNPAAALSCPDIYIGAGYSNLTEEGSGNVVTQLTVSGTTLTVRRGTVSGGGGGIVSNVTEGTENSWDAGSGSLVINTNPPTSGGGGTANPAWNYTADSLDTFAASVEYSQTTNALGLAFSALSTDASTEEPIGDRAGVVIPQAATNLVWTLSGYGVVTAALSVVTRYATNDAAAWSVIETNSLGASLTEVADYQWTTLVSLAAGDLVVWSVWPKQATGDFRTRALRLEAR